MTLTKTLTAAALATLFLVSGSLEAAPTVKFRGANQANGTKKRGISVTGPGGHGIQARSFKRPGHRRRFGFRAR